MTASEPTIDINITYINVYGANKPDPGTLIVVSTTSEELYTSLPKNFDLGKLNLSYIESHSKSFLT
jgi:hypothetical protein